MKTRVHVCVDPHDVGLAAEILRLLSNPLTGVAAEAPLERGSFGAMNADAIRSVLVERISQADAVACLVGPNAHHSPWVAWELDTGVARGRGIVGIRLRSAHRDFLPRRLVRAGAQIVDTHPGSVIASLERAAFVARAGTGNK